MTIQSLREIAKALAAFFAALASSLAVASTADQGLDGAGLLVSTVGALAAGLLTFSVPNAKPTGLRRAGDEPE